MNSHLSIHTTQHALRFGDLSAADFERLCLGLLQSESGEWQQVQHYVRRSKAEAGCRH